MTNCYTNLNYFDTRALIEAHAKQLAEYPNLIPEHIDHLQALAKHYSNKVDQWRYQHMLTQLQYARQVREFEREIQQYQPDSTDKELVN